MVMAGGTGGHVFPGLAVAHHLMDQGWQVRWLGTADRMEADLVPKNGIEIDFIRISGLRGKGIKAQLLAPVRIFNAWRQARAIMKRFQPDVVLGMGGYVSGPGGLAAWSLGIPVVLHEQNGIAGLTNKWLAKIAKKVMQAFPGAFPHADVVGNPVRTDVLALPLPGQRLVGRQGPIRVLVVGGSQGARALRATDHQHANRSLPAHQTLTWQRQRQYIGAHRVPNDVRMRERAGKRLHHFLRNLRQPLVSQAGNAVLLVEDHRDPQRPRRQTARPGNIAAHAQHHVRLETLHDRPRLTPGVKDTHRRQ